MDMLPLSLADVGTENTIKKIGGSPEVKKHLENLGWMLQYFAQRNEPAKQQAMVRSKERVFRRSPRTCWTHYPPSTTACCCRRRRRRRRRPRRA